MPGISNTWDPNVAKCLTREIACRLKAMGMLLTVGTDAGCQNTFFEETWKEIWLLTEVCKLTEAEANIRLLYRAHRLWDGRMSEELVRDTGQI